MEGTLIYKIADIVYKTTTVLVYIVFINFIIIQSFKLLNLMF